MTEQEQVDYGRRRRKCPNCGTEKVRVVYTEESAAAAKEKADKATPEEYCDTHRVKCLNERCLWSGIVDQLFP